MPRPQKKKLKFTEESVNDFLQELYNDSLYIRTEVKNLKDKWTKHVNEGGEIAAIGKDIIGLLNAESKNQEQRIMLFKYLKEIVFAPDKTKGETSQESINKDDKSELLKMVRETLTEKKKSN